MMDIIMIKKYLNVLASKKKKEEEKQNENK